jgi:hypothetical protein
MVGGTVPEDVFGNIPAECAGNQYVVFTGIFVLGILWVYDDMYIPKAVCVATSHMQYFSALGNGNFRTDILSQICVDFMVCTAGYIGAGFNSKGM